VKADEVVGWLPRRPAQVLNIHEQKIVSSPMSSSGGADACGVEHRGSSRRGRQPPRVRPVVSGVGASYLMAYQTLPAAAPPRAMADLVGMEVSHRVGVRPAGKAGL